MACVRSSFCGIIDEIPEIRVDNFENTFSKNLCAYFLSHCHTDHTIGLFGDCNELITELESTNAKIYMSKTTADIIKYESKYPEINEHIVPVDIGIPYTVSLQADGMKNLEVTLIPAGHSLGSVMFLFKTQNIMVLYTGDFRLRPRDLPQMKLLNKDGQPIHIDTLYVDTTFQGLQYTHFPKRSESTEEVLNKMQCWLELSDDNAIAIKQSAKFAYEFFFNQIFDVLKEKVNVGDKWGFYKNIQDSIPGVTSDPKSRIHLCYDNNKGHYKCNLVNENQKFLIIRLCAMSFKNYEIEENTLRQINDTSLSVCFATHCSQFELQCFVNYLSPKRVVGFRDKYKRFEVMSENTDESAGKQFDVLKRKRKVVLRNNNYEAKNLKMLNNEIV